jgi:hypothetical protein
MSLTLSVTGFITQELVNIAADDDGGEMDVSLPYLFSTAVGF